MLKIGDKLLCHNNCVMQYTHRVTVTKGVYYKILSFDIDNDGIQRFYILNDDGNGHSFRINKYKEWFYDIKNQRKFKLEKLKNV